MRKVLVVMVEAHERGEGKGTAKVRKGESYWENIQKMSTEEGRWRSTTAQNEEKVEMKKQREVANEGSEKGSKGSDLQPEG